MMIDECSCVCSICQITSVSYHSVFVVDYEGWQGQKAKHCLRNHPKFDFNRQQIYVVVAVHVNFKTSFQFHLCARLSESRGVI